MYNILLVDDEPIIVEALKKQSFWDDLGLEVIGIVYNGQDAIKILDTQKVHILITDIRMPVMDGLELIRQIHRMDLNIYVIILSGYDDFAYVKEAIKLGVENYLLKPLNKSELISTLSDIVAKLQKESDVKLGLEEQKNVFRENLLNRLVVNNIDKKEFVERANVIDLNLDWQDFFVVIISLIYKSGPSEDYNAINTVLKLFQNQFKSDILQTFLDPSYNIIVIFSCGQIAANNGLLMSRLSSFVTSTKENLGFSLFISIGNAVSGLENAHISYNMANRLQRYCYLAASSSVIDSELLKHTFSSKREYGDVDYNILTNFFVTRKKAECQEYLKCTFKKMKLDDEFTPIIFKSNMLKMLFHIINIIKKLVANSEDIPDEIRYFDISFETSTSLCEIEANTLFIVNKAFEYLEQKEDNTNYTIKQILDYVNQNMELNLSLKTLSYKFAVNASYLGQLFKKETGVMFSSYLNNIRIERAKELLENSQMKISEVSEKVGFLDPSHFYKLFKNSTGLSPADYKEKVANR